MGNCPIGVRKLSLLERGNDVNRVKVTILENQRTENCALNLVFLLSHLEGFYQTK